MLMTTLTDLPLDVLGSIMDIRVKAKNAAAVTLQKAWRGAIQRLQESAQLVRMVRRKVSLRPQWFGSFGSDWRTEMHIALEEEGIRPTSWLFEGMWWTIPKTRLRQEYTPRQRASIFWDAL